MDINLEKPVAIIRKTCVMEDEGNEFFVKSCSYKEAKELIAAQKNEYYKPSDYKILISE